MHTFLYRCGYRRHGVFAKVILWYTLQDHPTSGNVPNGESEPSQTLANLVHHFGRLKQDEIWSQIHWNYSWCIIRLPLTWHLQIIIYKQVCLKLICFHVYFHWWGLFLTFRFWFPFQIHGTNGIFTCMKTHTNPQIYLNGLRGEVASAKLCLQRLGVGLDQAWQPTALNRGLVIVINPCPLRFFLGCPI